MEMEKRNTEANNPRLKGAKASTRYMRERLDHKTAKRCSESYRKIRNAEARLYDPSEKDKEFIAEHKAMLADIYSSPEARAKVIDDWATAYCIKKGLGPDDVVLIQQLTPAGVVYYFEEKKKEKVMEANKDNNNA